MKQALIIAALGLAALIGIVAVYPGGEGRAQAGPAGRTEDARLVREGARLRAAMQNDPVAPTVAPRGHDVTIVLFSDYQCPYCRKIYPTLRTLVQQDGKVRLVYRDWPIFGEASVEAARAAIASRYQGRHGAFNDALMRAEGRLNSASIRAAANRAGVDWSRLEADLDRHGSRIDEAIDRTRGYADMLGLSGTPAMLVGPYMVPGAISLDDLKKVVALAREQPDPFR